MASYNEEQPESFHYLIPGLDNNIEVPLLQEPEPLSQLMDVRNINNHHEEYQNPPEKEEIKLIQPIVRKVLEENVEEEIKIEKLKEEGIKVEDIEEEEIKVVDIEEIKLGENRDIIVPPIMEGKGNINSLIQLRVSNSQREEEIMPEQEGIRLSQQIRASVKNKAQDPYIDYDDDHLQIRHNMDLRVSYIYTHIYIYIYIARISS